MNPLSGVSEGMHRRENMKGGNSSQPSSLEEKQEPKEPEQICA